MTAGSIHTEELSCSWTCAAAGSQVLSGSVQVIGAKRKNSVGVRRILTGLTGLLSPILSFPTPTHTDTTPKSTIKYLNYPTKKHTKESPRFFLPSPRSSSSASFCDLLRSPNKSVWACGKHSETVSQHDSFCNARNYQRLKNIKFNYLWRFSRQNGSRSFVSTLLWQGCMQQKSLAKLEVLIRHAIGQLDTTGEFVNCSTVAQ